MHRALVICDRCGAFGLWEDGRLPRGWIELPYPIGVEAEAVDRHAFGPPVMIDSRRGEFCPICADMIRRGWEHLWKDVREALERHFVLMGEARFREQWQREHGPAVVDGESGA